MAVAPNGNKWERADNNGLWFLPEPDGETSPLDDSIVSALGLQVYREEPEPPFVEAQMAGGVLWGYVDARGHVPWPEGALLLIVPDTPENRARLTERRQ